MEISESYALADALYRAGYEDRKRERDYDPRGVAQWQAVVDALPRSRQEGRVEGMQELEKAVGSDPWRAYQVIQRSIAAALRELEGGEG